jgi:hypothetical protein
MVDTLFRKHLFSEPLKTYACDPGFMRVLTVWFSWGFLNTPADAIQPSPYTPVQFFMEAPGAMGGSSPRPNAYPPLTFLR